MNDAPSKSVLKEVNLETKRTLLAKLLTTINSTDELFTSEVAEASSQKEMCPLVPPKLGKLGVDFIQ